MMEFAFPIIAIATAFLLFIPAFTLLARGLSALLDRYGREDQRIVSNVRLAILVAPVAIPVLWLFSSALHDAETLRDVQACFFHHTPQEYCFDGLIIAGGLTMITLFSVLRTFRSRPNLSPVSTAPSDKRLFHRRLSAIQAAVSLPSHMQLVVLQDAPAALLSFGLFRPKIGIDAQFFATAPMDVLAAGIAHEIAHCRHHDVFSQTLIDVVLRLNITRAWLMPTRDKWFASRELACDNEAVHNGADPLALSQAIVLSARHGLAAMKEGIQAHVHMQRHSQKHGHSQPAGSWASMIGNAHERWANERWLALRISLLSMRAEADAAAPDLRPARTAHRRAYVRALDGMPMLRTVALLALVLPHIVATNAFNAFHHLSESVLFSAGLF